MNKVLKVFLYSISISLLFLVLTNPSIKDFKDFVGVPYDKGSEKRIKNYFIFSIYETRDYGPIRYYGIMKNFYLIGRVK